LAEGERVIHHAHRGAARSVNFGVNPGVGGGVCPLLLPPSLCAQGGVVMKRLTVFAAALASSLSLGASAGAASPSEAPWVGLRLRGAHVVEVVSPSPAQVAGLEADDTVLSVDGVPTRSGADVARAIAGGKLGDVTVVRVQRGDKRLSFAVFLAAKPEAAVQAPAEDGAAADEGAGEPFADPDAVPVPAEVPRAPVVAEPWAEGGAPAVRPPARPPRDPYARAGAAVRGRESARAADDDIATLDLERYRGQVVVVEFMATWCGACRGTVPVLNAWSERYGDAGLVVINASSEEAGLLRRHRESAGIRTVVALDPDGNLASQHDVTALPTLVVFDRQGRARGRFVGGGGNLHEIERIFRGLLREGDRDDHGVRF